MPSGIYIRTKPAWNKGLHIYNGGGFKKGHKRSMESIVKQKSHIMGNDNPKWRGGLPNCLTCNKQLSQRGYKHCIQHRPTDKISGKNHYLWKGGVTPLRKKVEKSLQYKLWRRAVFERDDYTCQICGQRGGELNADHIKPFALFPEFRFDINNGRILCVPCHKTTDTYGIKLTQRL
ncbi:HNH endonuclease [Candidatus Dojkabacteria bacterium]|jgi:5-methylcytosine-specific restriction endonuclease McrA|nr:HNH endonuclease [Candidatus Dojkabacteria bacterium]